MNQKHDSRWKAKQSRSDIDSRFPPKQSADGPHLLTSCAREPTEYILLSIALLPTPRVGCVEDHD